MTKYKQYTQQLDKLFDNRIHWLKVAVKKVQGRPPTFTRSKIDKGIIILQNLASEILVRQIFKRDSDNLIKQKKRWHTKNKGWGRTEKKKSFNSWFKKYINYKNYVYVFWAGKDECIYVGRSIVGKTRPQDHFEKYWFNPINSSLTD